MTRSIECLSESWLTDILFIPVTQALSWKLVEMCENFKISTIKSLAPPSRNSLDLLTPLTASPRNPTIERLKLSEPPAQSKKYYKPIKTRLSFNYYYYFISFDYSDLISPVEAVDQKTFIPRVNAVEPTFLHCGLDKGFTARITLTWN